MLRAVKLLSIIHLRLHNHCNIPVPYLLKRVINVQRVTCVTRLLICDILLFDSTYTIRKLTFLGVQKCASCEIGYHRDRNIRARSLKNGSILYEDFELRNEVTVSFPMEGIFQKTFAF